MFFTLMAVVTSAPDVGAAQPFELFVPDGEVTEREPSVAAAESLMNRAHRAGITGVRSGLGVMRRMSDGTARFSALPNARMHRSQGAFFAADRDADRVAFNARYGTALLTEASTRDELRQRKAAVPLGYRDYAPIDFGGGLTVGRIVSTDSGTGRWDFFNADIVAPLVAGKRVLDLGCNNGSMPLMMLRAGAARVIGIERTPQIADFARLAGRILAWRDMRTYDFQVITSDMRLFLVHDFGPIDVVTAFCSLYYVPESDMRRIVQKAAAIGATLILQSNEVIDNLPARAAALRTLMIDNGYATVDVHDAPGFARSLVVGAAPVAAPPLAANLARVAGG
jgi:hypothetical protein